MTIPVRRYVPANGSGGYVPDEQKKRGYVPDSKRANRHEAVDMFPRTGTKNDYLFRFLVPCRDRRFAELLIMLIQNRTLIKDEFCKYALWHPYGHHRRRGVQIGGIIDGYIKTIRRKS